MTCSRRSTFSVHLKVSVAVSISANTSGLWSRVGRLCDAPGCEYKRAGIEVLVLDSVPRDQNELVEAEARGYVGVNTAALLVPARLATRLYFLADL